ncbi:MAG: MerR family transcriptional regulator [Mycobacteriales bacterium]
MTPGEQRPYADRERPLFTVGQVADMLEVQQAFLRRLDQQELVSPARSDGYQRRYSMADVDRVSEICDLIGEGLTLPGVRRVLELQAEVVALQKQVKDLRAAARRRT